jgi:acyl-[acyl-carrier-protein]-phospholipid O-acyltransferase/long-chain-fatty-acid--[acyl-carrier-protein] ligase
MDILHHRFIRIAKKFLEKPAIIDQTTNKRLTYKRALIGGLILADKFSGYKEKHLGVMMPTSAGGFLSTIAVLIAGKVPAMINYSTDAEKNSRYAQTQCGFETIITSRALLEKIGCPVVPGMVCIEDIMRRITVFDKIVAGVKAIRSPEAIIRSLDRTEVGDTAVILFTSGSEKAPKGVQLSHGNISANLRDILEALPLSSDERIMSILPLFHVFGHTINFWLPMTTGMTAITYANPLDYKTVPEIIRKEKATIIAATPIFFAGYLRESHQGDFDSLHLVMAGADKTPDGLRQGFREKHGIELFEGYGTTETSPAISFNTPSANRPGSIGKVLPGVEVKIADLLTDAPLAVGTEGRILVRGDLVMKGYLDPEQTAAVINDGWYDTGDMGLLDDDGYLWHKGRLKRFVKIGGEMVSLVKVEAALEELLPAGIDCCVVDIPDETRGAAIVVVLTAEIDKEQILEQLKKVLSQIEIPKNFMVIEEIPKMGSGKADFRSVTRIVREKYATDSSE